MKYLSIIFIICQLAGGTFSACAQLQGQVYHFNPDAKVFAWGKEKTLAWCGGANNPQFAMADINNDQKEDLVVYEPWIGLKTFLNTGSTGNAEYVYAPQFEHNFPPVYGYLKLADYNDDGIADLFHNGFSVYQGRFDSGQLKFSYYTSLHYTHPLTGKTLAYVGSSDIPAIEDIDHDGDLDFLAYYNGGELIYWYRNCRKEDGLPADSIRICVKDDCWGKTFQQSQRSHLLHTSCSGGGLSCKGCVTPETGNKTTDGSNTLCVLDYDGDGDFDYFDGNAHFSDIQLLLNGKNDFNFSADSMLWQDTMWKSGGHQLHMPAWPAAYWLDIDQDNAKDLLFSPTTGGTENYKCIAHYKNTGSDASPNFVYQSDTFLIEKMIDAGSSSYPFFYDYNKDGKIDLFVGSDGYYQPDGTIRGKVSYYKNTSSSSITSFELQTMDFMQLSNYLFQGTSIAIGDIDDDGKDDLVLGHTDGKLSYFKNQATSAVAQPAWNPVQIVMKDASGNDIKVSDHAAPVIYDMNKDGRKDLVIGTGLGYLTYYESQSAGGNISLQFKTNKLGNVKADPNAQEPVYTMNAPFIGKMDNTGVDYLVVGSNEGRLSRFDGFQNGNVTTDYTLIDSNYSWLMPGLRTAPAFADLDSNNKFELVVGNKLGGLSFYKQLFDVSVPENMDANTTIKLYPNPAQRSLTVETVEPMTKADLRIYNTVGQVVHAAEVSTGTGIMNVDIEHLQPGIYVCLLRINGELKVARFTKLNNL